MFTYRYRDRYLIVIFIETLGPGLNLFRLLPAAGQTFTLVAYYLDPNDFEAYEPGLFWADSFDNGWRMPDWLLVPMDSRATASPTGDDDYVFYREGGWSWSIPYIAGLYALAAQVDPGITPDRFWAAALATGQTIEVNRNGEIIPLGLIVDPVALIAAL